MVLSSLLPNLVFMLPFVPCYEAMPLGRKVVAGVLASASGTVSPPSCEERMEMAAMVDHCLQLNSHGLCVSRIGPESIDQTDPVACCCPFKLSTGNLSAETAVLDAPQGMCTCGSSKPLEERVADKTAVAAFNVGWTYDVNTVWIEEDLGRASLP